MYGLFPTGLTEGSAVRDTPKRGDPQGLGHQTPTPRAQVSWCNSFSFALGIFLLEQPPRDQAKIHVVKMTMGHMIRRHRTQQRESHRPDSRTRKHGKTSSNEHPRFLLENLTLLLLSNWDIDRKASI